MKIPIALLAATAATASASSRTLSGKASKNLLSKARKLEDAEEEEFAFLMNYKLKLRSCIAGETVQNAENGEYEYNAVVFRLCPDTGDCDDDTTDGCKEGYGDYVVGLNTFVQEYMEDQRENMQYDDNFNPAEYAECREYENDNDDGNGVAYYIGPACTEDGSDIKLQMFSDEACMYVPEDVTFEEVSNGWTLPYSSGGFVSTYCNSCTEYNDNGEYEAKEFCQKLFEDASGKCETNMETYHYYGKDESACEHILEIVPAQSKSGGGGGKVVGWFFFIAIVGAFAGYVVWWKKKKASGGSASDGLMA
jgi:hypothetical protein